MTRPLILTRPKAQSETFAAEVAHRLPGRFTPLVAPLLEIAFTPRPLDLGGVGFLLFTSANGVEAFAAASPDRSLPALCVGAMTAAAAGNLGFEARSAAGDVAALTDLAASLWRKGDGAMLHVRGRHAAGDLIGALSARGVPAGSVELYDQVRRPLSDEARAVIARGEAVVVPLFSPRTARLFAAATVDLDLSRATVVALSEAAAAPLAGGRRLVATTPGREGMLDALARV